VKAVLWAVCSLMLSMCAAEREPVTAPLRVRVLSEDETPLKGARVHVDGRSVGVSDKQGWVKTELAGPGGRRCRVGVACPGDLVPRDRKQKIVSVRYLREIGRGVENLVPIEIGFTCVSPIKKSVLVVSADGRAALPIRALGRQIAITDRQGFAQTVIEGLPGDEIEVVIDTSENPKLRPRMPSRRLRLPGSSQIYIFDQKFILRASERKKGRKAHSGPRRIR
jgi:hypothetical protein